ncbi:MarR family transcriptional regulator [Bacillus sp. FJAT-49736]|uniref:MarR family winged helix-turn-helix transcriptional regulator n=1 Tax=Bacillus sp. FJAT-49736 TaxID=2833582 RepID=UPI001BC8CE08|nr:MarR family transcriptional regulator [Bacillus sp. FJAT-49736]MBS4172302.1 MarR family transcriptional regulator [Bacillus sp. FJAT-49736]
MIIMEKDEQEALKLFIVLSRAFRIINEYSNQFIQNCGLHPTEFAVLELLYHKGEQPLQQIGEKILLASGSITYVVDKLEKRGLLYRVSCPEDRRVTFAHISEKGKELIDAIFPEHQRRIVNIMSVLTPEEKETAIKLLKNIGYHTKTLI